MSTVRCPLCVRSPVLTALRADDALHDARSAATSHNASGEFLHCFRSITAERARHDLAIGFDDSAAVEIAFPVSSATATNEREYSHPDSVPRRTAAISVERPWADTGDDEETDHELWTTAVVVWEKSNHRGSPGNEENARGDRQIVPGAHPLCFRVWIWCLPAIWVHCSCSSILILDLEMSSDALRRCE